MAGPDFGALWQQFLYLSTLHDQNKLTGDQVTQWQNVQAQLSDPANKDAVQSALDALPPEQQNQLTALAAKGTTQDGHPASPTAPAAPGAPAGLTPDANGNYTPAQVGQMLVQAALNAPGGGGGDINVNETTAQKTATTAETRGTGVVYQNLPTPEEYLDKWDNAFTAHISGLEQTGAISTQVGDWARDQSGMFYGNYVRAQLADVLKGNPLFKVSGLNPDNKLIGTRQGAFDTSTMTAAEKEAYQLSQQSSGGGGMSALTLDNILRGSPSANIGLGPAARAAASPGGGSFNLSQTGTVDTQNQQLNSMQEAIVQRNELGVVANLAPIDFLSKGADAQAINMLYAGHKGDVQRARETATGEAAGAEVRRQQ